MSGWRWDVADEGYFGHPQSLLKAEPWWKADISGYENAAEMAADVYWNNHDGWEDSWPVTFHIYPPDSDEFTVVEVDMEMEPVFYGGVKPAPAAVTPGGDDE